MPIDVDAMKKRFKGAGNRFTFFLAIEYYKKDICKGIAKGLKDVTPEKFNKMVDEGEFFAIPQDIIIELSGWKQHVKYVKSQLLGEIFAEARPDLFQVLMDKGADGGVWLIALHKYLTNLILSTKEITEDDKKGNEIVSITCGHCSQSFPIAKKDFPGLKECPLCHAPADEPDDPDQPEQTETLPSPEEGTT
jgi:hypothetical protein